MPELPEVETIRRGLVSRIIGSTIKGYEVRVPKVVQGDPKQLIGRTIKQVRRHGKLLVFVLDDASVFTVHLKMTGQLLWRGKGEAVMGGHPSQGYLDPLPHKHTRVVLEFTDGTHLFFNDLRRFGRLSILTEEALSETPFVASLGPEPLSDGFTLDYLKERIVKKKSAVLKVFLLDQTNIAGLGNIYADESCWRAGIFPLRKINTLHAEEIERLYSAIIDTLELALEHGGSSERDYINAIGEKGTYLKVANVYHRTGLPCTRNDGGVIERVKVAGRSTHFCPICQV